MQIILLILSAIVDYITIIFMWGWFIVPTFGLPLLNIPQAIGLNLVTSVLTFHISPSTLHLSEKEQLQYQQLVFIVRISILLTGWIVHFFM